MTTEISEENQESGKDLRTRLEAEIGKSKSLQTVLATEVSKGFKFVKAEDLAEVDATQMRSTAEELETQRAKEREDLLADALKDRGLEGDELETVLSRLVPTKESEEDDPASRVASLGQLSGTPPQRQEQELYGEDRIRAAIAASHKKR